MALLVILAVDAWMCSAEDGANLPPVHFTGTNFIGLAVGGSWLSAKQPVPGIYETRPFVCMVKIPAPTDDKCIVRGIVSEKMPEKNPSLTLIPSQSKK